MRRWATAAVLLALLAGCAPAHPAGTVRHRSEPWTGTSAYCWPLEGTPDLPFRWIVTGVRPAHAGSSSPRTVSVQVVRTPAADVATDLDRALPGSGWRRPAGSWPVGTPARFTDHEGRTVTVRVVPLPGALAGTPVTSTIVLDLPRGVTMSRTRPPCPDGSAS
ncbi:hypothetical protein GCM10009798_23550 [Nocardioides panacihumi]|uniref:DUF2771 family protein n=1 Tax=Nocardioides panacihumi TaxID=400774 RepID=A0ABN2R3G8_9ACTN